MLLINKRSWSYLHEVACLDGSKHARERVWWLLELCFSIWCQPEETWSMFIGYIYIEFNLTQLGKEIQLINGDSKGE